MRYKAVLWAGLAMALAACSSLRGPTPLDVQSGAALGTVEGPKNCQLGIAREGRFAGLDLTRGNAQVAALDYSLHQIVLASPGEGGTWRIQGAFPRDARLSVQPGKTTRVQAGPPFTVAIDARPIDGGHCIDFGALITGAGGETYNPPVPPRGGRSGGFKLLNEKGRVVANGSFEYG